MVENLRFWSNFWPFAHFLPTFKNGFGHEKPSIYAGLRAFCPLSHFFFLFNCDKKIKNI